jgi:hypothetical protein
METVELLVVFALASLALFTFTYFFFDFASRGGNGGTRRSFSITFARLFGLITVAFVGAFLTFADVETEFATSAYTLLGTIAGYLAGASATRTRAAPQDGGTQASPPTELSL